MVQKAQFDSYEGETITFRLRTPYTDVADLYSEVAVEKTNQSGKYDVSSIPDAQTGLFEVGLDDGAGNNISNRWIRLTGSTSTYHQVYRSLADLLSAEASGVGTATVVVTVEETDSDPVIGAEVWITADAAGSILVAGVQTTDSNGQVSYLLETGENYYVWAKKVGWDSVLAEAVVAASSVTVTMDEASVATYYSARADIELVYGPNNVESWADPDNSREAATITARINWANLMAQTMIDARMHGGPYDIPFSAPYPQMVVFCAASLAGLLLYDTRQITSAGDAGVDRLNVHRENVMMILNKIHAGKIHLLTAAGAELTLKDTRSPKVVEGTSATDTFKAQGIPFTKIDDWE